jgi:restriction endonuclease fold toxin 9 of polymorphic toxin system
MRDRQRMSLHRFLLLYGAGLVAVLLLLGGLAGALALVRSQQQRADRAPFDIAVSNLAVAPAMEYRISTGAATPALDVRIGRHGEAVGTGTVNGQQFRYLTVGGKTFIQPPAGMLAGLAGSSPAAALQGKWVTGGALGAATPGAATQLPSPIQLASRLQAALGRTSTFPAASDPGTTVDRVPALRASTPSGDLYITRNAPYRVLRLAPGHAKNHNALFADRFAAQPDLSGGDSLDVASMSPDQVAGFYGDLVKDTGQLSSAVDEDIQFQLNGSADLSCSVGGCQVTAHVTANVTSTNPRARITGGQVGAQLTGTVLVEGRPAGGCAAAATLPLNGAGQISCYDAAAGPVFAEVDAEKKQQALQQSQAEGGAPVQYTINSTGEAYVAAIAQVDVAVLVQTEQKEAQEAAGESNCTPAGTSRAATAGAPVLMVAVHEAVSCTSGANGAALSGTQIHNKFSDFLNDVGNGYRGKQTLPSGKSIDGSVFDPSIGKRVPIELKPANDAQWRRATSQIAGYEQGMGVPAGSGQIWQYSTDSNGNLLFTRVE